MGILIVTIIAVIALAIFFLIGFDRIAGRGAHQVKDGINKSKLESFHELSAENYSQLKTLFGLNNDFFINFSEEIYFNEEKIEGMGKEPEQEKNLLVSTRYVILDNKTSTMFVTIWN